MNETALARIACPGEVAGGPGALECELQLQALLPGQWTTLWTCSVLFTDEPARAERLQGFATQQRQLAAQQTELQRRLDEKSAVRVNSAPQLNSLTVYESILDITHAALTIGLQPPEWLRRLFLSSVPGNICPGLMLPFMISCQWRSSAHCPALVARSDRGPCGGRRPGRARSASCGRRTRASQQRSGAWAARHWQMRPPLRAGCASCRR